jgi:hypothetical protein
MMEAITAWFLCWLVAFGGATVDVFEFEGATWESSPVQQESEESSKESTSLSTVSSTMASGSTSTPMAEASSGSEPSNQQEISEQSTTTTEPEHGAGHLVAGCIVVDLVWDETGFGQPVGEAPTGWKRDVIGTFLNFQFEDGPLDSIELVVGQEWVDVCY